MDGQVSQTTAPRGEALDNGQKHEYARRNGKSRTFSKGQTYCLLSHPQSLERSARKNLKLLLLTNKGLNTAFVLKESCGQPREAWARNFFDDCASIDPKVVRFHSFVLLLIQHFRNRSFRT